jgi:hypothetical protein
MTMPSKGEGSFRNRDEMINWLRGHRLTQGLSHRGDNN